MSAFFSKIEVVERDGNSIPKVLKMTFSSGIEVRYDQSKEALPHALCTKMTLHDFVPPNWDYVEQNEEPMNFEALKTNCLFV